DRRTVEGDAFLEDGLVERRRGHGEVLDDAGQVTEADVDVLDLLVGDQLDDVVGGCFCHCRRSPSLIQTRTDAMEPMLHASQPYVAPTLRNGSLSWLHGG